MKTILPRKIISASISGTFFAIILGLTLPNPAGDLNLSSIKSYLVTTSTIIPIYMMYSFPAILIYGVLTSIISDKLGDFISIKVKEKKAELFVSGASHIIFGLILFWFSLGASIIFFITDRILRSRYKKYKWLGAIKSLAIPALTWLLFMGIVWGNDMFFS
ncbi:hypothetical protein M3226_02705 [Neobacillus cucumis]|uniref:hypothetical protein n=1 Tax=Neobacillus cucumis TaxID=1740721 RepID=UPI002041DD0B|nr:hypothetical protein [Neobacillus cucumis]MCM3724612.1 hypothetical protein [Neobacillus cucumis]